ncbi:hypothetical protein DDB_G0277215 [Dictyostelium discoideum AX4]|uniref:Adenylate dimethylallyltransferase n=1 Tax=Dictyostelium discoideum TaxID=44689 RepID=IPT_DICDI|nr:hypothetical protein DDB_G0277215 [Dictyostelium discoideum AX4]Q86K86.1 RecName: Full=Adenylate dimethylallyltransferase; AltName: Full=Isopentenyl transferase [Dictyostelium discoideum]EAL68793.1 hypothetical protein DDB_G0277215 [Dictyostelium discoideum AX4]|eukprot:XP_642693.1 hypothetical protein DDB_G0277215 [Dictyostelium discoideum AX4]
MKILLIIGSTGVGKTDLSINYSKKYNAPVVVLDRIQCFPELSITSGRPDESEYFGSKRIYLTDLLVEPGNENIKKTFYVNKLINILNEIKNNYDTQNLPNEKGYGCIFEGGSISLLKELLTKINKLPYKITCVIYIRPSDSIDNHKLYKAKIFKRVSQMLFPTEEGNDSQILEVKRILNKGKTVNAQGEINLEYYEKIKQVLISLVGLVGIEDVIHFLDKQYDQKNITSKLDPNYLNEIQSQLIETITLAHYNYALSQIELIDSLIKQLPKSIEYCLKNIEIN